MCLQLIIFAIQTVGASSTTLKSAKSDEAEENEEKESLEPRSSISGNSVSKPIEIRVQGSAKTRDRAGSKLLFVTFVKILQDK